jgi:hypothetical protein
MMSAQASRRRFLTHTGAWPALLQSKGPHGITLLHHSRAGGEAAKAVEDYLLTLGAQ